MGSSCFCDCGDFLCVQGTELNDDRTPSDATVTTTFNILVIDINDNAPEFNSSEYSVAITELAQVGFALPLFIQVVDKDEVSGGACGPSALTARLIYAPLGGEPGVSVSCF